MKVRELIDELDGITDKDVEVVVTFGTQEFVVDSVDLNESDDEDSDDVCEIVVTNDPGV